MILSIGYTDGTWNTTIIDMPTNISEEEAGIFIEQEVVKLWARRKDR
jgi:hypothetical protein